MVLPRPVELAALTGNCPTTGSFVAARMSRWKCHIECQRQFPRLPFAPITLRVDVVFGSDVYFSWSGLGFLMNSSKLFAVRLPQFVNKTLPDRYQGLINHILR